MAGWCSSASVLLGMRPCPHVLSSNAGVMACKAWGNNVTNGRHTSSGTGLPSMQATSCRSDKSKMQAPAQSLQAVPAAHPCAAAAVQQGSSPQGCCAICLQQQPSHSSLIMLATYVCAATAIYRRSRLQSCCAGGDVAWHMTLALACQAQLLHFTYEHQCRSDTYLRHKNLCQGADGCTSTGGPDMSRRGIRVQVG